MKLRSNPREALRRELGRSPLLRDLKALVEQEYEHGIDVLTIYLGLQAGIADALTTFAPDLLDRPQLRLAVYHGEHIATIDDGRWMTLIREFLPGRPAVKLDLIQVPEWSCDPEQAYTELGETLAGMPPPHTFALAQYEPGVQRPDVAIVINPDLAEYPADLDEHPWVLELMDAGIPMLLTYFDAVGTNIIGRAMLDSGLGAVELYEGPFGTPMEDDHHEREDDFVSGRHFAWVSPEAQPGAFRNQRALKQLDELAEAYRETQELLIPLGNLGHYVERRGKPMIFGFYGAVLNLQTGQAYRLHAGGRLVREDRPNQDPVPTPEQAQAMSPLQRCEAVDRAYLPAGFGELELAVIRGLLRDPKEREQVLDALVSAFDEGDPEEAERMAKVLRHLGTVDGIEEGLPAFVAASQDNAQALRAQVAAGASIAERDQCGATALHVAAALNALDALRALLELGADPSAADALGVTPLRLALMVHHDEAALQLLQAGASVRDDELQPALGELLACPARAPALRAWLQTQALLARRPN